MSTCVQLMPLDGLRFSPSLSDYTARCQAVSSTPVAPLHHPGPSRSSNAIRHSMVPDYKVIILVLWWTAIISAALSCRNHPRWLAIVLMLPTFPLRHHRNTTTFRDRPKGSLINPLLYCSPTATRRSPSYWLSPKPTFVTTIRSSFTSSWKPVSLVNSR